METTTPALSLLERFNRWMQESIMIKLLSIGFLILILLIPTSWIEDVIAERELRSEEVIRDISGKWSGSQTIAGPILVIPYTKREVLDRGKEGKEMIERTVQAFFLPEDLNITGAVKPEVLHRGIFDAVVYESTLGIKASFATPDFKALDIPEDLVHWPDAHLVFGISDLRGISDTPTIRVGGESREAQPANDIGVAIQQSSYETDEYQSGSVRNHNQAYSNGMSIDLGWTSATDFKENTSIDISIKGSRNLDFIPVGKTTAVSLKSSWPDPSFDGEFLPDSREISPEGFTANWKVLHFNRPFSQQWTERQQPLGSANFGVTLLMPVDQYQKSMRTAKYGILIILLTFISLFLVEITQKIRIHPFQYILVGAALTIYYTLLLSISEQLGYNAAYIIASVATVVLISLYALTFLRTKRLAVVFTSLLSLFYGFIFVIILQQDFSLLIGSIGLFITVGVLMYFSRKVNWYDASKTAGVGN
jgi:inner membrane protein